MTRADMDAVRDEFVAATRRADAAGFDLLELHMAHGYLLSLVPLAADQPARRRVRRRDRAKFPLEVFDACRAVWPAEKPMSRADLGDRLGRRAASTATTRSRSRAGWSRHGCDIVDVSTGQVSPDQQPAYGRSYQTPFADRIRHEAGIPTIAVGAISSYDDVNTIILAGRADLCALARPHLCDPHWTLHAAADQGVDDRVDPAVPLAAARDAADRQGRAPDAAAPLRRGAPRVQERSSVTGGKRGIGARDRGALRGAGDVDRARQRRPRRDRRGRGRARASASSAGRRAGQQRRRVVQRAARSARRSTSGSAQIAVNATGAFLCTRAVLDGMRERDRGRIVTVASVASHVGSRYTSRLHGLQARGARPHARRSRPRSPAPASPRNAVCPAYVRTRHDRRDDREHRGAHRARTARRRWRDGAARAADRARGGRVRGRVLRRAPRPGAINGQTLIIDGGGVQQ